MKALQFVKVGEPLVWVDLPNPVPGPGEVVIDVRAAGLCHSDVGYIEGVIPDISLPRVLGHEVAGVISALGDGVTGHSVGDRVVISSSADGTVGDLYAAGAEGSSWLGVTRDGGYEEKAIALVSELRSIPDGVDFAQAAVATDAGMTSYAAVRGAGEVVTGTRVGIIGLGGLGLSGAKFAVLAGAEVYAAEINPAVHPAGLDAGVRECVTEVSDLARFNLDVIIDFAGFGTTTVDALQAVRQRGRVVLVGMGAGIASIATPSFIMKEATLVGSLGGTSADVEAVMAHMAQGEFRIDTHSIPFDEIPAGLERLAQGGIPGKRQVAER